MLNIQNYTNAHATTAYRNRAIKYIVLHYTAGVSSAAGTARNTANWFKNPSCKGSADFIVDDGSIVQYNPDIKNRYCWSVGGSKYSRMSTSEGGKFYNQCKNNNSISIEICSNKRNRATLLATDTDWYLTDAAIKNAVELTKSLMEQYNIAADHVIMHHHVTGKICPNPWTVNEAALTGWRDFKSKLTDSTATTQVTASTATTQTSYRVKVTASALNIRKGPGTHYAVSGQIKDKGVYTIVETSNGWGKLKSGAGWISLAYTNKV